MSHIRDFHIEQFRGVRDLKLTGLGQFNLLVGGNNSGKTTVLEAVDLHCHPLDILRFIAIAKRRDSESVRLPRLDSVQWMFPVLRESATKRFSRIVIRSVSYENKIESSKIEYNETKILEEVRTNYSYVFDKERDAFVLIEMPDSERELEQKEKRAFEITMQHVAETNEVSETYTVTDDLSVKAGFVNAVTTQLVTPIDHRSLPISSEALSESILLGDQDKVVELLRLFDPNISALQILTPGGRTPTPYLDHKVLGFAPVSVFGDGIRRALTLASAVVNCKDGILLIDEIETAVYVRALDNVYKWLVDACKTYNVQLIATTHSLEAVDSVLGAIDGSDLVTYKLEHKNDATVAKRFSGEELYDIRNEFGLDVR